MEQLGNTIAGASPDEDPEGHDGGKPISRMIAAAARTKLGTFPQKRVTRRTEASSVVRQSPVGILPELHVGGSRRSCEKVGLA